ncbi:MAG: hypothetical protein ACLFRI_07865, partial [Candidatus Izemoplasmataceae bacterium]
MKKLLIVAISFGFLFFLTPFSKESKAFTGDIDTTVQLCTVVDDVFTCDTATPVGLAYGNRVAFDSNVTPDTGERFAFWIYNGVVRPDLPIDHTFSIRSTTTLIAVTIPDDKVGALFIDTNGEMIDAQILDSGQTPVDPTSNSSITMPTKANYDVATTPWGSALSGITEDTVYTLKYELSASTTFDVTVNNGTGGGTDLTYNSIETVVADAPPAGEYFNGWEEDGIIVSKDESYTFSVLSDRTLTATYSATPLVDEPIITLSNDLELRSGYKSFVGQFYLPSGYELVEYGMVRSDDATVLSTLSNDQVFIGRTFIESTNEFLMSFSGSFTSIRAYLIVEQDGTLETYYSSQVSEYTQDFSFLDGSNSSYATSTQYTDSFNFEWDLLGAYEEDTPILGNSQ